MTSPYRVLHLWGQPLSDLPHSCGPRGGCACGEWLCVPSGDRPTGGVRGFRAPSSPSYPLSLDPVPVPTALRQRLSTWSQPLWGVKCDPFTGVTYQTSYVHIRYLQYNSN